MKKCPACNYELAPFDDNCPRCRRSTTTSPASASGVTTSPATAKRAPNTQKPMSVPFSWFSGALAAGATFFLPSAAFAFLSLALTNDDPKTTLSIVLFVTVCFFVPLLGGCGGYVGSAHGQFWWGAAAGAAFAILWALLCRMLSSGTEGSMLVAFIALLVYECGAVYGGIQRAQNGLTPIDGGVALSLVIGILCFALPVPGIIATTLLTRTDSDYSRPALFGTVAGLCIWTFLLVGAVVSNSQH